MVVHWGETACSTDRFDRWSRRRRKSGRAAGEETHHCSVEVDVTPDGSAYDSFISQVIEPAVR